jgi:hypothetical protein
MSRIVREIRGLKRVFGGPDQAGWLPPEAAAPHAKEATIDLEIIQNDDGFFLVSESSHPHFGGGDTWHQTLDDAIAQAELQFGVQRSEWKSPSTI